MRVFVPTDAAALALGADEVAAAVQETAEARGIAAGIVRNGSRGMFWLEPMVEVETPQGRIAYGPIEASEVPSLFDAGFLQGGSHPLRIGKPEEHPFLKRQTRLVFERCGITDPLCLKDYQAYKGFEGLRRAIRIGPAATIEDVILSGLRGRGGAGFPTGIKWRTAAEASAPQKYIVCNADEGDSGTFADRMLMEGDPYCLIEGMAIAAVAVGRHEGYIYIRSEYPHAVQTMSEAIDRARKAGLLGERLLGSNYAFDMEVRVGAGAYICGEETSLLESLEGKRGQVRAKPPMPAHKGLFGQPTVVNNVLSLASLPFILVEGGAGLSRLRHGPLPRHDADPARGQHQAWRPVRDRLRHHARGTHRRLSAAARQAAGRCAPCRSAARSGAYFPRALFDTPLDYEAFAARDGHGRPWRRRRVRRHRGHGEQARFAMEFCAIESCGKCTPCRIGSTRGVEVIDKDRRRATTAAANIALLDELCETMKYGSLCALGGFAPYPVLSALTHFPEDFARPSPGCGANRRFS